MNVLIIRLIESHKKPECSTQSEEKQKNQKLSIQRTKQKVSDILS